MDNPAQFIDVMTRAARKAGALHMDYFAHLGSLNVEVKKPSDFVSEADIVAENAVFDLLRGDYPDFGAHLEERGIIDAGDSDYRWIVDPLDGTSNFIHGIPHFSVSIGLAFRGEPIAGVVFNPVLNELFHAAKGEGAYLNGAPISVSKRRKLEEMVFGTGLPFRDKTGHEAFAAELVGPMQTLAGVRRFGSAAIDLSYVACGRFDAFWEHDLQPYDVAAGVVIVREAGGVVTRHSGVEEALPYNDILATNGVIHDEARRLTTVVG